MDFENYYQEYEPDFSDEVFDEIFNEGQHESSGQQHLHDAVSTESLDELIENLSYEIEGMTPAEAYEYVSEALPALIPLLTAIAPSVISAATTLAPMAIKAVSGAIGGMSRQAPPQPQPRYRPPQRPAPRPQYRSYPVQPQTAAPPPQPCGCQATPAPAPSAGGALAGIGQGALATLANLLSNQNVQNILSGLANQGISTALKLGKNEAVAREGALLNAIEYLAREAQNEAFDAQFNDSEDYLVGDEGEYVVDPDSADERAQRFLELFEI